MIACRVCGSELPDGALFCGECGSSVTTTRLRRAAIADHRPSDTSRIDLPLEPALPEPALPEPALPEPALPEPALPEPAVPEPELPEPALPELQPVEPAVSDAAVTLTFSTGAIATVVGSGLLGRRPATQPGEQFDQIVSVDDPGRSVSKTHLEFGLVDGRLWVCDRFSGNGTIVRSADGDVRLCEPGRRYRVEPGARVEIGDQSFTVS